MPSLPLDSKRAEFSMLQGEVNLAMWFAVAVPSLVTDEQEAVEVLGAFSERPAGLALTIPGGLVAESRVEVADVARGRLSTVRKAEAGFPPKVSASAALRA